MAQIIAQKVHTNNAIEKFISHVLARYQAGIIATSDGNGKNEDSSTIIIKIHVYQSQFTASTIRLIISCIKSIIIK